MGRAFAFAGCLLVAPVLAGCGDKDCKEICEQKVDDCRGIMACGFSLRCGP